MQEMTYDIICDDCDTEYTIIHLVDEELLIDRPIFCPFCGNGVDITIDEEDEMDEMDQLLNELDELDFDVD